MTTGKTIALTRWTFVGKVISLLFNTLSRLVITFLPVVKHLLISWLQSSFAVILEPPKIKSVTVSTVSPSICHEVMGPDAMIYRIKIHWEVTDGRMAPETRQGIMWLSQALITPPPSCCVLLYLKLKRIMTTEKKQHGSSTMWRLCWLIASN